MSDSILSRKDYENGGWNDGRLAQAYDLIAEVLDERGLLSFRDKTLTSIERLDDELAEQRP